MAVRAMWKAVIQGEAFELPVKLYAAVEDRTIRFHLLHDQDMVRVRQRMVNPETDQTVDFKDTIRGLEVAPHEFVTFTPEQLDALAPEPSRAIEILGFVNVDDVDPQWYDRPYWLGPDESTGEYFAFAEALHRHKCEAIARWTMRGKPYVGAIHHEDGYLALVTLRHQHEVITAQQLEPPVGRELDEQEKVLARKLVDALAADFDPSSYHDEYRERLEQLIEAKRKGEEIETEEYHEPAATDSLAESLQASLAAAH